jgi:acetolactate synthase-1/2/3 large subunit
MTTYPSDQTEPSIDVATALLEFLKLEGVDHVFGIPGGALVSMLKALKADGGVTYYICRHETGAAYMADGYARVSGELGVVVVTSGPGATNALTGAMNADASHSPVLVITGEVKEQFLGRGYLQDGVDAGLDVVEVFGNALGYSEIISSPANVDEFFTGAMRKMWGLPRRAAHLSLPDDVAESTATGFRLPKSRDTYRAKSVAAVDDGAVDDAVHAIVEARRPLLMLGNDCRRALGDEDVLGGFTKAVEHLSVPVMTSPNAKGIFPETHELSLRNYGIAGCRWPKLYFDWHGERYDALVVVGSALGQLTTDTWDESLVPDGAFVQMHEDPNVIGRAFPITTGVVGETVAVLRSFIRAANSALVDSDVAKDRAQLIDDIRKESPHVDADKRTSNDTPIKPQALARLVSEMILKGGHIFVDAGNCVGWCLHDMVIDPPTRIHSSLAMGPMGFATAAVVGAKLAAPRATCLAVVGDGGFMMHVGEVATAAQYRIGAIWVVLADHDLAMVSQGMAQVTRDAGFERYYKLAWTDLAAVAEGLGAKAWKVEAVDETTDALLRAFDGASRGIPQVIVATIDRTEKPPYRYPPPPPPQPLMPPPPR